MADTILTWILSTLTLLIGYTLGIYSTQPDRVGDFVRSVRDAVKRPQLGAVNKPEPEELAKRGTKLEETEKEVESLFDKILPKS